MYSRNDPRIRRTLNQVSQSLEQANESAQVGLFSVQEHYIRPCLGSVSQCFSQCTNTLFPRQDDRSRRARARARLPPEYSFDFYDDWEEDENAALLGADDDEIEPEPQSQPKRRTFMNYGSTSAPSAPRRSLGTAPDPTVIPGPSYFGLFSGLPFVAGKRALRYQPSAENLQERPQGRAVRRPEEERILEEDDGGDDFSEGGKARRTRDRSGTVTSAITEDSMSSRGDIFPSDEEDAVPLDDEFAMSFDHKSDETSSAKSKAKRGPRTSRKSSRSNKSLSQASRTSSTAQMSMSPRSMAEIEEVQALSALRKEEQEAQAEEEREIERRRSAAQDLAKRRGLDDEGLETHSSSPAKSLRSSESSAPASAGRSTSLQHEPTHVADRADQNTEGTQDNGG